LHSLQKPLSDSKNRWFQVLKNSKNHRVSWTNWQRPWQFSRWLSDFFQKNLWELWLYIKPGTWVF
jgi:hypothetical protein